LGEAVLGFEHELATIMVFTSQPVQNVVLALQEFANADAFANELAIQTLYPQKIEVVGVSDDAGNVLVLGGPGYVYRNDFQFIDPNDTAGFSRFLIGSSQVAAGPITTTNFRDSSGNAIFATSTIILTSGFGSGATLLRNGFLIGPVTATEDPPGSG